MTDEHKRVLATIEIPLSQEDIDNAEGDLHRAVQNVIGHTGAMVFDVEELP